MAVLTMALATSEQATSADTGTATTFYYNRAVTNVNFRTNVYERPVVFNGHTYGRGIENRVSYNGGQGGIRVAPRPC